LSELPRRSLGKSGIEVPIVGVGCNNFGGRTDEKRSARVILPPSTPCVGFFDTADIYGGGRSEEILGRTLGSRRDEAVIATSSGVDGLSRPQRWFAQLDRARRGGQPAPSPDDHIDLYQHHFFDAATPLEETLGALDNLVRAGKVRAIGSSNYEPAQIEKPDVIATVQGGRIT